MLFKKKRGLKPISESLRKKLLDEMYKLGYDVGYHHHSEIGWVVEAYNKPIASAAEYGIEDLLKEQYLKGKADGTERKRHESLAPTKVTVTEPSPLPKVERLPPAYRMVAKPAATEAPRSIEQPQMVDRPKALDGFAPVRPE
ncbi:MAG TPA: hypothetical protein EYP67_00280 [Methanosarcinales archaeon]|nr:hypothetical protein [Methanosarcinales archaeon]